MSQSRVLTMSDAINERFIRLPRKAVLEVGPAAQTLGGLLMITDKETFSSLSKIAAQARIPMGTLRHHMPILCEHGYISHRGRERTRSGRARRTATIGITAKTKVESENYWPLLWWSADVLFKSWSSRLLFSVIVSRAMGLRKAVDDRSEDLGEQADNFGDGRFDISLTKLNECTGMTRETIVSAKRTLLHAGFINWKGDNDGLTKDTIEPNWDSKIAVTSTAPGRVRVELIKPKKADAPATNTRARFMRY